MTGPIRESSAPADLSGRGQVILELQSVTKTFGPTRAVIDVSLQLRRGEVLALVGENGAGKSTCVSIVAGIYTPDSGSVILNGEPLVMASPLDSRAAGIAVVHQHPSLFPDLSVGENIYAGELPVRRGRVDWDEVHRNARRILQTLGLKVDPRVAVRELRTGEQQLVEIARALGSNASVLIMDEPSAALSAHEVSRLFEVVARLRDHHVAMMFVGHRLEEIFAISDRITILRDGGLVETRPTAQSTPRSVVARMVGRDLTDLYPHVPAAVGSEVLSVTHLTRAGEYSDISFVVRQGEILGLGGLVGAGRTEIARTIFGITRPDSGVIALHGKESRIGSPSAAQHHGIAYVSEDRRGQSVIDTFSILDNVSLPILSRTSTWGFTNRRRELDAVSGSLMKMRLRFASLMQPIGDLSGGNQQKVVLAKWLATNPQLLILDEPTQGIDVQTKAEVHRIVSDLADQGIAILLISSDMPELLAMSDRIVVLQGGSQVDEFPRETATQELVGAAAAGMLTDTTTAVDDQVDRAVSGARHEPADGGRSNTVDRTKRWRQPVQSVAQSREIGLVFAIVLMAVIATSVNSSFLSGSNLTSIFVDASLLGIIAVGEMVVILTHNIDVSVSSIVGLSAYVSASLVADHPGLPIMGAIIITIVIGAFCGLFNGVIIAYFNIPSIVATLGTLAMIRGLTAIIAGPRQISAGQVSDAWLAVSQHRIGPIPLLVIIAAVIMVVAGLVLRGTRLGREFYAIGSNTQAASVLGLRVPQRVVLAFVFSGSLAGLTGALWASNYATVDSRAATGIELNVIAAVVVGGVAILGGSGTILGVALGTLTLLVIQNGLSLMRVDPLWLQAVYGVVIVAAILLDQVIRQRQRKAVAI